LKFSALRNAFINVGIGVTALIVIAAILPMSFSEIFSGYDDLFWEDSIRRGVAIGIVSCVFFPLIMAFIKFSSHQDKRYRVANGTIPDAIFGGLKESGLLICCTWVFVTVLKVCFL